MSLKITKGHFSGARNTFGKNGMGEAIRMLALDHALIKVNAMTAANIKFTDNSTGAVSTKVTAIPTPAAAITAASGSGGAQLAGLNTAIGKVENAMAVLAQRLNVVRAALGLAALTYAVGTVTTPGTIPALDKTVTGAATNSAAQFTSGRTALRTMRNNMRNVQAAISETLVALGKAEVAGNFTGKFSQVASLPDIPNVDAANVGGTDVLSKADADAALTAAANSIASMAKIWNDAVDSLAGTPLHVVAG